MIRTLHRSTILAMLALALGAYAPSLLNAQDRPDQQRDQPSANQHEHGADERGATRDNAARGNAAHENPGRDNPAHENAAHENAAHENAGHANAGHERGDRDDVERLRKAHPRAAARCHDGFFTTTRTRARACTKHGGIDIWLVP
ncbi:MAG: hypothetical protein ACREUT_22275 [Steroidobacteraceae bacterium]